MIMSLLHRNFSLITYRTYAKWLKRKAIRVLTSKEAEEFHSSRSNSPAPKHSIDAETVGKTRKYLNQSNVEYETLHVGDQRFGYLTFSLK